MRNMIYFNNAAKARFDPTVVAAGMECVQKDPWNMNADGDKQRVRELYARLVGAAGPECIAIMPSTAFAISLAAQNCRAQLLQQKGTAKILLLADQYPSAVYPWQDLCQQSASNAETKFSLEVVPFPQENETWTSLILERLSSDNAIAIACLPPLFWADGATIDLDTIGPLCKARGITLIVDATQAVGIYPAVNVQRIQPAMMACSVHKWLRGPAGTCLTYIDPALVDVWQPLDQHDRARDWHGRSVADRGTMSPETGYPTDFLPGARKLDAGGRTQPILMPMLRAALEQVVNIDTTQAQEQLRTLMQPLYDLVSNDTAFQVHLPLRRNQEQACHILGLVPTKPLETKEMLDICQRLTDEFDIVVSVRCGVFRIAPYLDNTAEDVESLVEALKQVLRFAVIERKQE